MAETGPHLFFQIAANVVAISTMFVAVTFVMPWIEAFRARPLAEASLWPSPPSKSRPNFVPSAVASLVALGALGSFLLSDSVYDSLATRSRAQEYCVKKGFVDNIELTFVAQAWTQRFGEKLNANLVKQAKIEANRSLSASAKKAALRDVRSERRLL